MPRGEHENNILLFLLLNLNRLLAVEFVVFSLIRFNTETAICDAVRF